MGAILGGAIQRHRLAWPSHTARLRPLVWKLYWSGFSGWPGRERDYLPAADRLTFAGVLQHGAEIVVEPPRQLLASLPHFCNDCVRVHRSLPPFLGAVLMPSHHDIATDPCGQIARDGRLQIHARLHWVHLSPLFYCGTELPGNLSTGEQSEWADASLWQTVFGHALRTGCSLSSLWPDA